MACECSFSETCVECLVELRRPLQELLRQPLDPAVFDPSITPEPNFWQKQAEQYRTEWMTPSMIKHPFSVGDVVVFKDAANKKYPQRYIILSFSKSGHYVRLRKSGSDETVEAAVTSLELFTELLARHRMPVEECHNDNHDPGCTCGEGREKLPNPHHHRIHPETWFEEAQRIVNGDRAVAYGESTGGPEDTTVKIAKAWSAFLGVDVTPRMYCQLIIIMKMMRDTHKAKRDNMVDAAGYLLLAEKHEEN